MLLVWKGFISWRTVQLISPHLAPLTFTFTFTITFTCAKGHVWKVNKVGKVR